MLDLNALSLPRLFEELTADGSLDRLLNAALHEDLKEAGDITSDCVIGTDQTATAALVARKPGVIAGLPVAKRLISQHAFAQLQEMVTDGERVPANQTIAQATGALRSLLRIERVMLNIVGRMSGIATLTRQYVDVIAGTKAVICDTRKTVPGMRNLDKYAVRCGGGALHRIGLFDAALFKDNHLAGIPAAELGLRLTGAIRTLRSQHDVRFVQVEVDSLDQLRDVLELESGLVDMILLDNMTPELLRKAVTMRDAMAPGVLLEASGGVSLQTVRAIAESGVDRISVGALTHSAPWFDIGLDITSA